MSVQSTLQVCVPAGCPNDCVYCGAKQNSTAENTYANYVGGGNPKSGLSKEFYRKEFARKMSYARESGCGICMLTGTGEPLANKDFLEFFATVNDGLSNPFARVEMQTSGAGWKDVGMQFLREKVGVSTVSLSLGDIMSSEGNARINRTPDGLIVNIAEFCKEVKKYDLGLRLSLNMSDAYSAVSFDEIFARANELGADQITFKRLYISGPGEQSEQAEWIRKHGQTQACDAKMAELRKYVTNPDRGELLGKLPNGLENYAVNGLSVMVDADAAAEEIHTDGSYRYWILREDAHLYFRWDKKRASLIC